MIGTMVAETPQRDPIGEISVSNVLKEVTTNEITIPSKKDVNKVGKPQREGMEAIPILGWSCVGSPLTCLRGPLM